jgi:hypothetical protein
MELKITTETGTHADMPGTKYGKYLFKHSVVTEWIGSYIGMNGETDFNSGVCLLYLPVTEPGCPEKYPHSHNYDEYLSFFGMYPDGLTNLGAEIEISIGEEQEKHVFDAPMTLYFPKGLLHCPLKFNKVDRAIMVVHVFMTSKFDRRDGKWK